MESTVVQCSCPELPHTPFLSLSPSISPRSPLSLRTFLPLSSLSISHLPSPISHLPYPISLPSPIPYLPFSSPPLSLVKSRQRCIRWCGTGLVPSSLMTTSSHRSSPPTTFASPMPRGRRRATRRPETTRGKEWSTGGRGTRERREPASFICCVCNVYIMC